MTTFLTDPRSPAQLLAALLAAFDADELTPALIDQARAAVRAARRPTVTWASPRPGLHVVDGAPMRPGLVGMDAAFCAMHWPGQHHVRAADFSAPGAEHADVAARAALKRAAAFLDGFNPPLADAVRSIRVLDGFVVFMPSGRLDVVVR